jgi:hypothetical protein
MAQRLQIALYLPLDNHSSREGVRSRMTITLLEDEELNVSMLSTSCGAVFNSSSMYDGISTRLGLHKYTNWKKPGIYVRSILNSRSGCRVHVADLESAGANVKPERVVLADMDTIPESLQS